MNVFCACDSVDKTQTKCYACYKPIFRTYIRCENCQRTVHKWHDVPSEGVYCVRCFENIFPEKLRQGDTEVSKEILQHLLQESMMNEDNEDSLSYSKHFLGRCYTCGQPTVARDLIRVSYNHKDWYICELCHEAFWHSGYSPLQMGQELERTEKKREGSFSGIVRPKHELTDEKRQIKRKPICLEEIADFMYWLYKEGSKIIDKIN